MLYTLLRSLWTIESVDTIGLQKKTIIIPILLELGKARITLQLLGANSMQLSNDAAAIPMGHALHLLVEGGDMEASR